MDIGISLKNQMLYKSMCMLLACALVFSAVMTGSLAWNSDFNIINEFTGAQPKVYRTTLQKYEKDINGKLTTSPVKGAEFYLYKEDGGGDTQIGGKLLTDENGRITVTGLLKGTYYFLETDPTYAYTFDENASSDIVRYYFTIDKNTDSTQGVTVNAYNQRRHSRLLISKTVENADGSKLTNEQKELLFRFTVTFSDGGEYIYKIGNEEYTLKSGAVLRLKHGQTAVFEKLPVGVQYKVTETPVDGYIASSRGHQGNIMRRDAYADFVNTFFGDALDDATLIVKKRVDGVTTDREFNFILNINGKETPFTIKNGEGKTFTIPAGANYGVYENDYFPDGFALVSITNGYGTANGGVIEAVAENKYTGTEMIQVSGKKTWDASSDPSAKLPATITVHLMDGDRVVESKNITGNADGQWLYTFDAPKYRTDGITQIKYTVDETEIEGYIKSVNGFDIKNTYISPVTFNPGIQKTISGDTPSESAIFRFSLTAQDGTVPSVEIPMPNGSDGNVKTIAVTGAGEAKFGGIRFTKAGTYTYTISEIKESAAGYTYDDSVYTLTVEIEQQGSKLAVKSAVYTKAGNSKIYTKAAFSNVYTGPDFTSVKVTKVWIGRNADQPQNVQVQLYKDGEAYGNPVTLSDTNDWTHVWTALDKDAVWSVDEQAVPDRYTKQITGNAKDGFIINNIFDDDTIPPDTGEKITISGVKTWNHGDNYPASYPESIIIYVKNGNKTVIEKRITANEHWYWSFTLDQYDEQGNEINYTIDEAPVAGYTKHINGYNITNNHETYEKITISGAKTWEHGENTTKRPDSITVYVKIGDKIVAQKLVTAADGWKYSFELPKYDESGREIAYTIGEGNVPYYVMTSDGYSMTNTFKGYDYPGDSPKTGDDSSLWLWLVLTISSLTSLILLLVMGKKTRNGNRRVRH